MKKEKCEKLSLLKIGKIISVSILILSLTLSGIIMVSPSMALEDTMSNVSETRRIGDVNGDGKITLADAQMALRSALNIIDLNAEQKWAVDVNGDEVVKLADAQMILRASLNIITLPTISFNTTGFVALDDMGTSFMIENKLDVLSGTITGDVNVKTITLNISCGNLELVNISLNPSVNWEYTNPPLVVGECDVTVKLVTLDNVTTMAKVTLFNVADENTEGLDLDTNDNDGDGLLNWQEIIYSTDPDNPDSDGDGLTDYEEVFITRTNPILRDTNGDGIWDGDEDPDVDGISNLDEVHIYNTNPLNSDTDADNLSDSEEINTYKTDPLNPDTDRDKADDGWEVFYGTDPLFYNNSFPQTKSTGTLDENNPVTASASITLTGEQVGSFEITPVGAADEIRLAQTIPGYLGSAYDFTVDGTFNSAELAFEYDTSLGNIGDDFQPRIYYFDEATGELHELPNQYVTDGKISVTVDHFSKYILLNKVEFDQVWTIDIRPPKTSPDDPHESIDLMFVIDESNSMENNKYGDDNDPDRIRVDAAKKFTEALIEDDRAGIVGFSSDSRLIWSLESDMEVIRTQLDTISGSNGGTALYKGLNMAIDELIGNGNAEKRRIIIALTDGEDDPSAPEGEYEAVIKRANDAKITIYTMGLGDSVATVLLTSIAEQTDGKYYHATTADELYEGFEFVKSDAIDYTLDSNGDGISDYYSQLIFEGKLRLQNGSAELMGIDFNENPDMDGDGLLNGEEITILEVGDRIFIKMNSHPLMMDSDFDFVNDGEDEHPLKPDYYKLNDIMTLMEDGKFQYSIEADEFDQGWKKITDSLVSAASFTDLQQNYTKQMSYFFLNIANEKRLDALAVQEMHKALIDMIYEYIKESGSNIFFVINEGPDKIIVLHELGAKIKDAYKTLDDVTDAAKQFNISNKTIGGFKAQLTKVTNLYKNETALPGLKMLTEKLPDGTIKKIKQYFPTLSNPELMEKAGASFGLICNAIDLNKLKNDDEVWELAHGIANANANILAFRQNTEILEELCKNDNRVFTQNAAQFIYDIMAENYTSVYYRRIEQVIIEGGGILLDAGLNIAVLSGLSAIPPLPIIAITKGVFDICNSIGNWSEKTESRAELVCLSDITGVVIRFVNLGYSADDYYGLTRNLSNLVNLRIAGESKYIELYELYRFEKNTNEKAKAEQNIINVRSLANKMGLSTVY